MQAILFIAFFAFLQSAKFGNGKEYAATSVEVGNANDFMDQILVSVVKKHGHELDPHALPDLGLSLEKKILLITYTGRAQLHDGVLKGLRTLHRDGDCTMTKDDDGLYADVNLALNNLKFSYKGTVSFMGVGKSEDIYGSIGYLSINMIIKAKPGGKAKVDKFKVRKMKGLEVKFKGLKSVLNPFIKIITDLIVKKFHPALHNILEREVKVMVDQKLQEFDLPI